MSNKSFQNGGFETEYWAFTQLPKSNFYACITLVPQVKSDTAMAVKHDSCTRQLYLFFLFARLKIHKGAFEYFRHPLQTMDMHPLETMHMAAIIQQEEANASAAEEMAEEMAEEILAEEMAEAQRITNPDEASAAVGALTGYECKLFLLQVASNPEFAQLYEALTQHMIIQRQNGFPEEPAPPRALSVSPAIAAEMRQHAITTAAEAKRKALDSIDKAMEACGGVRPELQTARMRCIATASHIEGNPKSLKVTKIMVSGIFFLFRGQRYLFFAFLYFFRTPKPATEKNKIIALSDFCI